MVEINQGGAAFSEQGRLSHTGAFRRSALLTPFGIEGGGAADRMDALAWALSDLFPRMVKPVPDVSWEDERGGGGAGGYSQPRRVAYFPVE